MKNNPVEIGDEILIKDMKLLFGPDYFDKLLDPKLGVVTVPIEHQHRDLLPRLRKLSKPLKYQNAGMTTTNVHQNFSCCGGNDLAPIWGMFADAVASQTQNHFESSGFGNLLQGTLSFSDIVLQHYPPSKPDENYGISPHRDQSGFINLVIVLVVFGSAAFYVCEDKTAKGSIAISAKAGDLIVMRGGGFAAEINSVSGMAQPLPRPCHYIGRIEDPDGRLSFGMRQLVNDSEAAQKLRDFFDGNRNRYR